MLIYVDFMMRSPLTGYEGIAGIEITPLEEASLRSSPALWTS